MSVHFYNRVTGAKSSIVGGRSVLGLYQIENSDCEVYLNSVPLQPGSFLVPNAQAQWSLRIVQDARDQSQGVFHEDQLPGTLLVESIHTLSQEIGAHTSWLDWLDISPLVAKLKNRDRLELLPIDREIRDHVGALESVCRKPRMYLELEVERLPVSRARRVPSKATPYLASHTEDWAQRTLRSIVPKRILSFVREDDYDIYENRVARKLILELQRHLNKRIDELRAFRKILQEAGNYASETFGSYQRRDRIYSLWGELSEAGEKSKLVDQTLKELERIKYRVLGLQDSVLYQRVSQRSDIDTTLKMTNILSNDPRYRHVAFLWRRLALSEIAEKKKPEQVYELWQSFCHGYDRFCFLLVIRAFDQLGYEPINDDLEQDITPGAKLVLAGPYGTMSVLWAQDSSIIFTDDSTRILRIVPWATSLSAADDEHRLAQTIRDIAEDLRETESPLTLILYPPSVSSEPTHISEMLLHRLHSLGNDDVSVAERNLGFLPVSPWEISSVERIARALRWISMGRFLQQYPPRIETPPPAELKTGQVFEWLKPDPEQKSYEVIRLPRVDQERLLKVNEVEQALLQHEKELKAGIIEANDQVGRRSRLRQQLNDCQAKIDQLHGFCQELDKAMSYMHILLKCPTCSKTIPHNRFSVGASRFSCTCLECHTVWELRSCGSCKKQFPVLYPSHISQIGGEPTAGWIDRQLGSDVLAVPCGKSREKTSFICSHCGYCSCRACAANDKCKEEGVM